MYYYTFFSSVFTLEVTPVGKKTRRINPGEALILTLLASVTQRGDGSWHGGQPELAAATGQSERAVRDALAVLIEAGFIGVRKETVLRDGSTPITTTHYVCLLNFETKAEAPKEPTPAPVKKTRKARMEKAEEEKPFVPPTREEVAAYAAERGEPAFDADYFVSYYEATDWYKRNGEHVSSWRQTVLNWIKDDKKKADQQAAQQAPQYMEAHIQF